MTHHNTLGSNMQAQREYNRADMVDPELDLNLSPGEFLNCVAGSAIEGARTAELTLVEDEEISEEADRSQEVFAVSRNPDNYYEIDVKSDVENKNYREEASEAAWQLLDEGIEELREELDGGSLWLISSTHVGGGVSMQLPPEINFLREWDIDIHWGVARSQDPRFEVTKAMHNGQQDVNSSEEDLTLDFTETDAAEHLALGMDNLLGKDGFPGMWDIESFRKAKIYVFHDPQMVGMLPKLRELNPDAKFVYRNHIHTDRDKMAQEGSLQNKIYRHIHETCGVNNVDVYISHPVEEFAPYGTKNLAYQPPVSDLHEELNLKLSPETIAEKLDWTDRQIAKQNRRRQKINREKYGDEWVHIDDQKPLDRSRQWLTGFARFDWAKAQHLNMKLQKRVTDIMLEIGAPEELIPDTIIAGNGADDDTDREKVLSHMLDLRRTTYAAYQDRIKVIGTEHDFKAVSALTGSSMFSVNFSTKEGWEHRRAESMLKGVPSISSNAGGLPMQGKDGQGGFVANLEGLDSELDRIAVEIVGDILVPERHQKRKAATRAWAEEYIIPELTTVPNMIRELRILNGKGDTTWKIEDLIKQREELRAAAEEPERLRPER